MKANGLKRGYTHLGKRSASVPAQLQPELVLKFSHPNDPWSSPAGLQNKAVTPGSLLIEKLIGGREILLYHVKCRNQAWLDWRRQITVWRPLHARSSRAFHTWGALTRSPSSHIKKGMHSGLEPAPSLLLSPWRPLPRSPGPPRHPRPGGRPAFLHPLLGFRLCCYGRATPTQSRLYRSQWHCYRIVVTVSKLWLFKLFFFFFVKCTCRFMAMINENSWKQGCRRCTVCRRGQTSRFWTRRPPVTDLLFSNLKSPVTDGIIDIPNSPDWQNGITWYFFLDSISDRFAAFKQEYGSCACWWRYPELRSPLPQPGISTTL